MDTALDLASVAANFTFVALTVTALVVAGREPGTTYRRLVKATSLYRAAVAAAVLALLADLASVPYDGIWWVALPAVTTGCAVYSARSVQQRRDLKGERLADDAIRSLQREGWL